MSRSRAARPGAYGAAANGYQRFGGYLGRNGPPPDYVGWGVALAAVASLVAGRRRPLTWLLLFLAAATFWLALGAYLLSGPIVARTPVAALEGTLDAAGSQGDPAGSVRPVLTLFLAFLIAVGLDALHGARRPAAVVAGECTAPC